MYSREGLSVDSPVVVGSCGQRGADEAVALALCDQLKEVFPGRRRCEPDVEGDPDLDERESSIFLTPRHDAVRSGVRRRLVACAPGVVAKL